MGSVETALVGTMRHAGQMRSWKICSRPRSGIKSETGAHAPASSQLQVVDPVLNVERFSALPLSGTDPAKPRVHHRSPSFVDCARKADPAGSSATPGGACS